MAVDWGFAVQVGGMGFGMVFVLLIILAVVIWLTGLVVNSGKDKADNTQKGA
jgi:Na+-transporting methylmalonyl-CoA/oxaloacetate decarboxylase gamma subunit